jgi:hypothetical protein
MLLLEQKATSPCPVSCTRYEACYGGPDGGLGGGFQNDRPRGGSGGTPQKPAAPPPDFTKPECLPQEVKDTFKKAWEESGYGNKDRSEYSFAIAQNSTSGALTATAPKSTFESSAGNKSGSIPNVAGLKAGAHTHGPFDVPGLSELDKKTATDNGVAMYVMSRAGGLTLYDPANKDTQKSRRDLGHPDTIDYAYGIKVGDVIGKNAFWDKACK